MKSKDVITMAHLEEHTRIGGLLKEGVFGFNDGLVSTFAIIAGLTGGLVDNKTILLAALATLLAGAFSMGLGTYIGSKAERELYESELKREKYEMEHMPEVEQQEIRDIYHAKGFRGVLLEDVVKQIISDPKVWLKTMMVEELGFAQAPPKPGINGVVMSVAFIVGSVIPTAPYIFSQRFTQNAPLIMGKLSLIFTLSLTLSILGLLFAGALKTLFTKRNPFLSALESLIIGGFAAGGSYAIGIMLT